MLIKTSDYRLNQGFLISASLTLRQAWESSASQPPNRLFI